MHFRDIYDYAFFLIHREMKKIYPDHLDLVLYSLMVLFIFLSILLIPSIYLISNKYNEFVISRPVWIIGGGFFFVLNFWYFQKERIEKIERKFRDNGLRKKCKYIIYLLSTLALILFFMTLKRSELI